VKQHKNSYCKGVGVLPYFLYKGATMGNITQKSVLCNCLNLLDISPFHCPLTDRYTKKLSVGAAIVLFVEGQLQQRKALADIVLNLETNKDLQVFAGITSINESSLNRKLNSIPLAYLEWLFARLAQELKLRKRGAKGIRHFGNLTPVDSTTLSLPSVLGDWAYFQNQHKGVKIHTRLLSLESDFHIPDEIVLSTVGVADMKAVNRLVTQKDTTYIFDRGYVHYGNFKQWVEECVLFVARLKAKTRYTVLHERSVSKDSHVICDADVEILDQVSGQTFQARLVQFQDNKGNIYDVLTNRKELTAEDISEIYRCRWQIELFFKWIKQHLKAVKFHNNSPHAVWVQLYIGIITYLLCELIHLESESKLSLWDFIRKLRYYAMKTWSAFKRALKRKPRSTSRGRQKSLEPPDQPRWTGTKRKTVKIIVE
jgi:hypothetical protein